MSQRNTDRTIHARNITYLSFFFLALFSFSSCKTSVAPQTEFVLGTVCTINLYDKGTQAVYAEIFDRLREIEAILSANRDDTNIALINSNAGQTATAAKPETLYVLSAALRYSEKTNGRFDPTIGPLVKLWNIGTEYAAVPSQEDISMRLALINYRNVKIDEKAQTVFLTKPGMKIDLGAIAKGYAADQIAEIIEKYHISRAIVDLGGNILAIGEKKPGVPWKIGIRDPETEKGGSILALDIRNEAVVTSGVYERYFIENGKRYHHILDPATGFPVENGLLSVSIISPKSIDADALSTSVFLLGENAGARFIETLPDTDAIFIDQNRKVYVTSGLMGRIEVLDERFKLSGELN